MLSGAVFICIYNSQVCIMANFWSKWTVSQGAFHALRPEDLRRRPDFFVGVAASFFQ